MLRLNHYAGITSAQRLELLEAAKQIVKIYNLDNIDILIDFSHRLKRSAGNVSQSYDRRTRERTAEIKLSTKYITMFGFERIMKTLKHEFAHIIQFVEFGKTDHGYTFQKICHELGGSIQYTLVHKEFAVSACKEYITEIKYNYEYTCACGATFKRNKKFADKTLHRYSCSKCGTPRSKYTMKRIN